MNLNDIAAIRKIDKSDVLPSIALLPDQCEQAWEEAQQVVVPEIYKQVKNIVIAGMGGSGLGAHVLKSLYGLDGLNVPLQIVNDYHLPAYVSSESLVLLSSYSGTTEETLSCAEEALVKKAKILGITSGGKLRQFLTQNNLPGYIFVPKHNLCGQPRIGLGYMLTGTMALLQNTKVLSLEKADKIPQIFKNLRSVKGNLQIKAQEIVKKLIGKIPVLVAAEFLSGNTHVLANQFNENAKTTSFYFLLPELNHHLLESLKNPKSQDLVFLFFHSNLYTSEIKTRLKLTEAVVGKNDFKALEFCPSGQNKLLDALETLWFGSFLSFYLAISYGLNPSPIPWVDYFKEQLKKYKT